MRDLLVILAVVLLVFGAKWLRTLGSDLGTAVKSFRKAMAEPPAEQRLEQMTSGRPDAEFPETAAARNRGDRGGA
jgi:sec-independent protein translocase protein TatA